MRVTYKEAPPQGPVPGGDVGGDDAVTEGYCRRLFGRVDATTWVTADVTFYFWQKGTFNEEPTGPMYLAREIEFSLVEGSYYDSGDVVHADCRSVNVAEHTEPATMAAARKACAAFDPTVLDWDGTWPIPAECWSAGLS